MLATPPPGGKRLAPEDASGRPPGRGGVVFRCDGDEQIGAGHVARCVQLAAALGRLGWSTDFVGDYGGLAGWLLGRAGFRGRPVDPTAPCGVAAEGYRFAVVDSYTLDPAAICKLARALPLVTMAEANRCPQRGVLLDYHLDRADARNERLLAGPRFAPLDPAFAAAGRAGEQVRNVLVSTGGSRRARAPRSEIASIAAAIFERARVLVAGGLQSETVDASDSRIIALPRPSSALDVLPEIDLAIGAAGLSAYELACAGVPQLAIAINDNQRRVVEGLRRQDLALCLDLTSGDSLGDLPAALRRLRDPGVRRRFAERGMKVFDGGGAERAAIALTELFDT